MKKHDEIIGRRNTRECFLLPNLPCELNLCLNNIEQFLDTRTQRIKTGQNGSFVCERHPLNRTVCRHPRLFHVLRCLWRPAKWSLHRKLDSTHFTPLQFKVFPVSLIPCWRLHPHELCLVYTTHHHTLRKGISQQIRGKKSTSPRLLTAGIMLTPSFFQQTDPWLPAWQSERYNQKSFKTNCMGGVHL